MANHVGYYRTILIYSVVIRIKSLPPPCPVPISVPVPPGTYELPRVQRNNWCSWSRCPRHWVKSVGILHIEYHWFALQHPSFARIWTQLVDRLVHVGRNNRNWGLLLGFILVLNPVALHPLDYVVDKRCQGHPCSQWVHSIFYEGYQLVKVAIKINIVCQDFCFRKAHDEYVEESNLYADCSEEVEKFFMGSAKYNKKSITQLYYDDEVAGQGRGDVVDKEEGGYGNQSDAEQNRGINASLAVLSEEGANIRIVLGGWKVQKVSNYEHDNSSYQHPLAPDGGSLQDGVLLGLNAEGSHNVGGWENHQHVGYVVGNSKGCYFELPMGWFAGEYRYEQKNGWQEIKSHRYQNHDVIGKTKKFLIAVDVVGRVESLLGWRGEMKPIVTEDKTPVGDGLLKNCNFRVL